MNVHINTGGPVAWITKHAQCDRCWHYCTQYGRCQIWYDTDWYCGRCGMRNFRPGPPRKDRDRTIWVRKAFTQWLVDGSPQLDISPYITHAP